MSDLIRPATTADAPGIGAIYRHYVATSTATFETEPPDDDAMAARIARVRDAGLPYLVAQRGDHLLGYAYAGPFQEREAYRHALESSIYLAPAGVGAGLGTRLYGHLLDEVAALSAADSRHAPVHRVYARVAVPNPGSEALHTRLGFQPAGVWHEAGRKFDRWIDVALFELRLPAPS